MRRVETAAERVRARHVHAGGGIGRLLGVVRLSGNSMLVTFYAHENWRRLFEGASGTDATLIANDVT